MSVFENILNLLPDTVATFWLVPLFLVGVGCWRFVRRQMELEKSVTEKNEQIAGLQIALDQQKKSNELLHKRMLEVQQWLEQVDTLLADARSQIRAVADSIIVRHPFVDDAMVFLIVHGPAAHRVAKMQVDLHGSQAGSVFLSRKTSIYSPHTMNMAHEKRIDRKSGFQSNNMLTKPLLKFGSEAVGVVQFLNDNPQHPFTAADEGRIEPICAKLALAVSAIVADSINLVHLGIVLDPHISQASVVFTDITNSDLLFQELAVADATGLVDEYLERVGAIGVSHGARIDKYLGDGMMLSFESGGVDHPVEAFLTAVAMQQEFRTIQQEWLRLYPALNAVSHRVGVASGPVYGRRMGSGPSSVFTIMGRPVNLAAHLCDLARETQEGILLCEATGRLVQQKLPSEWVLRPISPTSQAAFEVLRTESRE